MAELPDCILIDRRRRLVDSFVADVFAGAEVTIEESQSPLGPTVWVARVLLPEGVGPPVNVSVDGQGYTRILDRFYLPDVPDPAASTALFDVAAHDYDSLVDVGRNTENIRALLKVVVAALGPNQERPRILDFGCGTGLSVEALDSGEALCSSPIELIGTDASPAMLTEASHRGMKTLDFRAWDRLPARSMDAAIASFVFHCGIDDKEAETISKQLKDGASFVGNYHHATEPLVNGLCKQLDRFGLVLERRMPGHGGPKNPILVFRARR